MNIKVGGIHYEVFEKEIVENDPNEYGVCVYADNHIEIKSGLSDERKTQTLTHELLHAIFFEAGYEDHDEKMVDRLSLVLNQVLKENDLSKYFD